MTDELKEEVKRGKGEEGKSQNPEPGTHPSTGSGQETQNSEPAAADAAEATAASPHPVEALLDKYPLRDPSEDPVWSVRIVRGWLYFLAFNFAWMLLFLVLGIFID